MTVRIPPREPGGSQRPQERELAVFGGLVLLAALLLLPAAVLLLAAALLLLAALLPLLAALLLLVELHRLGLLGILVVLRVAIHAFGTPSPPHRSRKVTR